MKHGKIDQRTMPYLPDEIIEDILKRVPVKSLIRFQCVCNHWKHVIKSQCFMVQHLQQSSNRNPFLVLGCQMHFDTILRLFLLDSSLGLHQIDTASFVDVYSRIYKHDIVGSCNGLLLVQNHEIPHPSYSLLNPATKSVTHIPLIDCRALNHRCVTGFGFSPFVNDFKIVSTCSRRFGGSVGRVDVFSLSRGSWKEINIGALKGVRLSHESVTVNGAIFWWGVKAENEDEDRRDVLISFDIAKEVFTLIQKPFSLSRKFTHFRNLTVYRNKFAILCGTKVLGDVLINLWVLEEAACASRNPWSCWTTQYGSIPASYLIYSVIIWGNEIVCKFKDTSISGEDFIYMMNLTSYEVKRFDIPCCHSVPDICNYVESLY